MKDIARQNVDSPEYPFEPIEKLTRADPIRLQGDTYKGKLHYVAEFIPAYNLRGLTFESRGNEMDQAKGSESESGEEVAAGDPESDGGDIPDGVTMHAQKPKPEANGGGHARQASVDSAHTDDKASVKTSGSKKTNRTTKTARSVPPAIPEKVGLEMSREDLFKQRMYPTFANFAHAKTNVDCPFFRIRRSNLRGDIWNSS